MVCVAGFPASLQKPQKRGGLRQWRKAQGSPPPPVSREQKAGNSRHGDPVLATQLKNAPVLRITAQLYVLHQEPEVKKVRLPVCVSFFLKTIGKNKGR